MPNFSSSRKIKTCSHVSGYLSAWGSPMILDQPEHGYAEIRFEWNDGAGVYYLPDSGFEGLDAVKVELSDGLVFQFLFQVYCDQSSSTKKTDISCLKLFPNPAQSELNLDILAQPQTITAYATDGSAQQLECDFSSKKIKVNGLKAGMYTLKIQTKEELFIGRFVKL